MLLFSHRNTPLPLTEYTQNVVNFVDCMLGTSSSDDHIKDFVSAGGLYPLVSLLSLPALPLNFPISTACNTVISACKAVLVSYKAQQCITTTHSTCKLRPSL